MRASALTMVLVLSLAAARAEQVAPRPALEPDGQQVRAARVLANNLPLMHLNRAPVDDRIATNALSIFLDSLDPDRSYFLAPDIASFQEQGADLDDQLGQGNLDFAFRVYDLFKRRVADRVAFTQRLLDAGLDMESDETYTWKRSDASWPADEEAWNDLWRKRIKNQYVARLVADQLGEPSVEEGALDEDEEQTHSEAEAAKMTPAENILKSYQRFQTIIEDNDATWLVDRYLNAFTAAYDPHTSYLSPPSLEDFEIGMGLSLQGIGAMLSSEDGAAKVERLIPGGPAERDGRLKPGDKIVGVAQGDGEMVDILHWPLSRAVRLIRGEKGSKVVLKVLPASDASGATSVRVDLVRDEVKLEEQAARGEVHDIKSGDGSGYRVGVIALPEFYADMRPSGRRDEEPRSCTRDVAKIIEDFKRQDVDGIVLDLRNNGGGSLSEAVEMTGLFIPKGPVVQVKDQRRVQTLSDPDSSVAYNGPLIVLVNRMSASASEILAAALQDYGRAVLVGDSKTHGKGTVQSLTALNSARPGLGSLKVTTASFYRIAGGSTQLKGVTPDIVIPSLLDGMEVGEENLPHALGWSAVAPVSYRPGHLAEVLPALRKNSEERRSTDPRFAAFADLLQRLRERQASKEVPLKLEKRLALAREERALQKQLEAVEKSATAPEAAPAETAAKDAGGGEKVQTAEQKKADRTRNDLVLQESLQIMMDWIASNEQKAAVTTAKTGHAI